MRAFSIFTVLAAIGLILASPAALEARTRSRAKVNGNGSGIVITDSRGPGGGGYGIMKNIGSPENGFVYTGEYTGAGATVCSPMAASDLGPETVTVYQDAGPYAGYLLDSPVFSPYTRLNYPPGLPGRYNGFPAVGGSTTRVDGSGFPVSNEYMNRVPKFIHYNSTNAVIR